MRFQTSLAVAFVLLSALSGCATSQRYAWGSYEKSLYVYYKVPATAGKFAQSLQTVISDSERTKAPVAPGIYAEYGYLLLQQGNRADAVVSFRREETQWPESKIFMDHMIQVASGNSVAQVPAKEP